ncbi:hypothetical protein TNCV_5070271 [Trichonephila clavipes]|nr:hypothetical protein TNCV_5070271 [Trichonephila clavipes]
MIRRRSQHLKGRTNWRTERRQTNIHQLPQYTVSNKLLHQPSPVYDDGHSLIFRFGSRPRPLTTEPVVGNEDITIRETFRATSA